MTQVPRQPTYRLCVAPMMAWTDRHCRFLHRLLAPSARLYTEMVSTDALMHGDPTRALAFDPSEHPVALQVGGNDPVHLASAARMAARAGFDEVNLNVGCPSERVQKGAIGACLMRQPDLVANGVRAMRDAVDIPVTVKCRMGVADSADMLAAAQDDYGPLRDFAGKVTDAGVQTLIVHARKAILNGLTPAQNRSVPPLRPDLVAKLARDMPDIDIVMNGGIDDIGQALDCLDWAAGVMVGRKAYRDPAWLSRLHAATCNDHVVTPEEAAAAYLPYMAHQLGQGVRLQDMTRHMLTLFNGRPGARAYRRQLSTLQRHATGGLATFVAAVRSVSTLEPAPALL